MGKNSNIIIGVVEMSMILHSKELLDLVKSKVVSVKIDEFHEKLVNNEDIISIGYHHDTII